MVRNVVVKASSYVLSSVKCIIQRSVCSEQGCSGRREGEERRYRVRPSKCNRPVPSIPINHGRSCTLPIACPVAFGNCGVSGTGILSLGILSS